MQHKALIDAACKAIDRTYARYCGFKVGAALATISGNVFRGCNVENLSFGLTVCAESAAVAAAISNVKKDFAAIASVTGAIEPPVTCGARRQGLPELNPNLKIVAATVSGQVQEFDLGKLFRAPNQGVLEAMRRV
jgi:cytidine deaminase